MVEMKRLIGSKAGRLVLLLRLRDAGVLESKSVRAIADWLGVGRSTIFRDLTVLDQVDAAYQQLQRDRPWERLEGWATLNELAASTGYSRDHLALLARQGRVEARKTYGCWWVHRGSLDAYAASAGKRPGAPRGPRKRQQR